MVQLFKGITSEADALLNDLQDSLNSQERKLTTYAEQQREVGFLVTYKWKYFQCHFSSLVSFHSGKRLNEFDMIYRLIAELLSRQDQFLKLQ